MMRNQASSEHPSPTRERGIFSGYVPRLRVGLGLVVVMLLGSRVIPSNVPQKNDPTSWGTDHVGKPVPKYVTGDECLFCHRKKVAPTWVANPHNLTIHRADDDSPAINALKQSNNKKLIEEIDLILGNKGRQLFLRKSEAYGKVDVHSLAFAPAKDGNGGKLITTNNPHWDAKKFGESCAGCHATGVDSTKQTFSSWSLDCYTCHGDVDLDHSKKKPELVYLAKKRNDPAKVVISICASCHVRNGKSKSSGRPYPNNFVAGDNLFRDFQVDFSDATLNSLSVADRHVLENVRDVVVSGNGKVTCLSCHDVHGRSSRKHRFVKKSDYCLNCHHAEGPRKKVKPITAYNKTCEYPGEGSNDGK